MHDDGPPDMAGEEGGIPAEMEMDGGEGVEMEQHQEMDQH